MSLTLLANPQKTIIICVDEFSFFTTDVSELDFRWTLPNQQSETQNITLTNVGTNLGIVLSISLPSGFFTTQTFPQTVGVGGSLVIPIYFSASTIADYSDDTIIDTNSNTISVSLLAVVQSKGLQFDGVNDYVISTQDVNWGRAQSWTMFAKYKDINWSSFPRNCFFSNATEDSNIRGIGIGEITRLGAQFLVVLRNIASSNELVCRFSDANTFDTSGIIQITYNGTSLLNGVRMYVNGVEKTSRAAEQAQTLSGTITASGQKAKIGRYVTASPNLFSSNTDIQEISFVNYVKSGAELTDDYNAGFQSKGIGDWLFRQSFNVGGTPINLKADVLAGAEIDTTIIGQTSGDFVNF